ncbi:hypothetical protein LXL04_016023 [Taraxacum kok-saghyz]
MVTACLVNCLQAMMVKRHFRYLLQGYGDNIDVDLTNQHGNKSLLNLVFATEMEKLQDVWCFFTLCSNEDPYYVLATGPPFPYYVPYGVRNDGPNGAGKKFQNNKEDMSNSVTLGVAEEHIRIVVGRSVITVSDYVYIMIPAMTVIHETIFLGTETAAALKAQTSTDHESSTERISIEIWQMKPIIIKVPCKNYEALSSIWY